MLEVSILFCHWISSGEKKGLEVNYALFAIIER
jgi:hypothetical protein